MEKRARESLEECINDLNPVLNKYIYRIHKLMKKEIHYILLKHIKK